VAGIGVTARRTVVVTGGGRGLGRGIALALARQDCDLVLGWRHDDTAMATTIGELGDLGAAAVAVRGDVRDPAAAADLVKTATEEFGGIDVWVNNAGISVLAPFLSTTVEEMVAMMEVNYFGTFHGLQAAAAAMVGTGRGRRIINVASDLGLRAAPMLAGYSATKFAVVGLTQAAAVELAPHGIRVNAVCPGTVETDMVRAEEDAEAGWAGTSIENVRRRLLAEVPAGRLCSADDVGALVSWLASPAAEFVTGQAICTNGGSILH
jgi:meso-butanediol dehydrogenase / (S,S)-butanediol dehydrogenase / diacetyl reductase